MAVHWTISFKSFLGADRVVSIYDDTYTGDAVALTGAASPFSTEEDAEEDIYQPVHTQSGYIRFITQSTTIIQDLMPTSVTDRPVVLREGNTVLWIGFLSGEQYDQPFDRPAYEVELPVISLMSAMKGIYFTQSKGFNSLYTLIQTINNYSPEELSITAPAECPFKNVMVSNDNWQTFLTIPEREARDTTDAFETATLYDIMEDWCKYFCMSMHEYGDRLIFTTTDAATYYDYDLSGSSQESQYGDDTLASLAICSDKNRVSYASAYRRITGTFRTSYNKNTNILGFEEFLKSFRVYDTLDLATIFYGNDEIKCYHNGTSGPVGADLSRTQLNTSGGQISRRADTDWNDPNSWLGMSWSDTFAVCSINGHAQASAIKFYCKNRITIAADETAIINIVASVKQGDNSPGEDGIKKLHCKMRVGNYWLQSEHPTGSTVTMLSWTGTETDCWLPVANQALTTDYLLQFPSRLAAYFPKSGGVLLSPPDGIKGTSAEVYFEILANAEDASEFGEYSNIIYNISDLAINLIHCDNDNTRISPSLDANTIIRTLSNIHGEEYDFDCNITTRRGIEYGPGVALDGDKEYQTTRYDEIGVERRAAVYDNNREIIKAIVRLRVQPNDTITYDGGRYAILSQSIDWRDDNNTINILKI